MDAITFVVVGHDEGRLLPRSLRDALAAARPQDVVLYADSASTDGSIAVAEAHGVEVVRAPLGKGRAMAAALEACATPLVCFVDADIRESTTNVPLMLARAYDGVPSDRIVADFDWPTKGILHAVTGVYDPLVAGLFPEAVGRYGRFKLSGFRILRTDLPLGELPPGFGVETYLNLLFAARGWSTGVAEVGIVEGPVRGKGGLGRELAEVILDLAEAEGRLDPARRHEWEAWVEGFMEVTATRPGPGEPAGTYPDRLRASAARPLPPSGVARSAEAAVALYRESGMPAAHAGSDT